jgi:DNA-binding CsgD family transcriptional regulator
MNSIGLTTRQIEIFDALVTNRSFKKLRDDLGLSVTGFNYHANNIYDLLDVNSRIELVCEYLLANCEPFNDLNLSIIKTETERLVFTLTMKGYSVTETADLIGLKSTQVRYSRIKIYKLAGVTSALELVFNCYGVEEHGK